MTRLFIRQSGGANIVSIPRAILKSLNLGVGASLELSVKNAQIILTPVKEPEVSLVDLLANSPKKKLHASSEDQEWLNSHNLGKEE